MAMLAISAALLVGMYVLPAGGGLLVQKVLAAPAHRHRLEAPCRASGGSVLAAWFGPAVLTLLGAVLYFAVFPSRLDFSGSWLATPPTAATWTPCAASWG